MTWEKCLDIRDRRSSSCEGRSCRCACGVPWLLDDEGIADCGGEAALPIGFLDEFEAAVSIELSFFGIACGDGLLLSEYGRVCPRSRHWRHIEGLKSCLGLTLSADIREVDGIGAMNDSTIGRDTCWSRGLIAC